MSNLRNLGGQQQSPIARGMNANDPKQGKDADAKNLRPVTDAYLDQDGRAVRLYQDKKSGLVGLVTPKNGNTKTIPGQQIHNGLNPAETGAPLLSKLSNGPTTAWNLVYIPEIDAIHVWPMLRAAAKNRDNFTIATTLNPFKDKTLAECGRMLEAKGFVQKFDAQQRASWVHPQTGRRAYLDLFWLSGNVTV